MALGGQSKTDLPHRILWQFLQEIFFGGGLCSTVHVERQFPLFNSLAVTAEAGKQFIAKSVTGDNVDGIYLKFVHRTKLLQD